MALIDELFAIPGRVAIITGGAGLLGRMHAEVIAELGGIPVLADVRESAAREVAVEMREDGFEALAVYCDVTSPDSIEETRKQVIGQFGRVDILINNAALDPKVEDDIAEAEDAAYSRFESLPLSRWEEEIEVGLTGAFLCSQVIGKEMADRGRGVILNILSDLAVIAPDQRIYEVDGLPRDSQPVKPVTYSAVKGGLLMMTRYLATYWAKEGVRVNGLSPGGIYTGQPEEFVFRLTNLIPMGRMASLDDYRGAVAFLVSDASSYMNGANLIVDGGRTTW